MTQSSWWRCPDCGAITHNTSDITYQYCGRCHEFKDEQSRALKEALRNAERRRAVMEADLDRVSSAPRAGQRGTVARSLQRLRVIGGAAFLFVVVPLAIIAFGILALR